MKPYARAAVESETAVLRTSSTGERACATFRAAAALGNLVGSGELDHAETEGLLLAAAMGTGLPEREAIQNIRRGIRRGERTPRSVPDAQAYGGSDVFLRRPHAIATPESAKTEEPPLRPPLAEVADLWNASHPLSADVEAASWFTRRYGENASTILEGGELWNLAKVVPRGVSLPRWAWSRGGSWIQTGHRLLFRLWDHNGMALSVRARCLDSSTSPKSLAPAGFSVKGLLLADPLGVQLLSGSAPDWWSPQEIVVSEGEPDWLTWAACQSEAHEQGPAYLGIVAGGWSLDVAGRIPDGARVVIRAHHDRSGQLYAQEISATLAGRCQLFRSPATEAVA